MEEEITMFQYLTFTMADELVVIDGARVREILEPSNLTKGTLLPDFMQGVVDLRGCLVPVIDLQLKLTIQEHLQLHSIFNISVELAKTGENVVLSGLIEVQEALTEVKPSQIDAAPHWLRCRINMNDFSVLFSNFIINASVANTTAKPEGDAPWPL